MHQCNFNKNEVSLMFTVIDVFCYCLQPADIVDISGYLKAGHQLAKTNKTTGMVLFNNLVPKPLCNAPLGSGYRLYTLYLPGCSAASQLSVLVTTLSNTL